MQTHLRKAFSRRLRFGQDWLVDCEFHLCTQIGFFKNVIYNLYPICFQKEFWKCKKIVELCKKKWQVDCIDYYTPN